MLLFALFFIIALFSACKKQLDYFSYVSELRSNILLAQTDEYLLTVYAVEKEYPYAADGVKRETSKRTEIRLLAPSGDKTYEIAFCVDNKNYGGEMSYDNVRAEYYFSCSVDVSNLDALDCKLIFKENTLDFHAKSVLTKDTLSPREIVEKVRLQESELFTSLTDKYGFAGEIYVRVLYEDFPYFYVGIIDKNGQISAFLVNGVTGKILAKRQG